MTLFVFCSITYGCFALSSDMQTKIGSSVERIGGSGTGYLEETISTELVDSNAFIAWHPSFSDYKRNVDGYFFIDSPASMQVSLGVWEKIHSASISYDKASSTGGYIVRADSSRASHPAIHGDKYLVTYRAGYYDFNQNRWQSSSIKTRAKVDNTFISIHYQ